MTKPRSEHMDHLPYELARDAEGRVRGHLIQPRDMAKRFPGCWAYLNARRAELEARNIVGGVAAERQWYQYGRSQSLTRISGEKIILPVLSLGPSYAYDDRDIVVTGGGNGPYYLIRPRSGADVSFGGVESSTQRSICANQYKRIGAGTTRHGQQFIETLPIPVPGGEIRAEIEPWYQLSES